MTKQNFSFTRVSGSANWIIPVVLAIVLALVAIAFFAFSQRSADPPSNPLERISALDPIGTEDQPLPEAEPTYESQPLIETEPQAPQPALSEWPEANPESNRDAADSLAINPDAIDMTEADGQLHDQLVTNLQPDQAQWVFKDRLIERIVVTINSLDGDGVPLRMRPLSHVPGLPAVENAGESLSLPMTADPRYQAYRELLDGVDPDQMVNLYLANQPAFEQAWISLGLLDTDFQTRLLGIIDHLLAFEYPAQPPALIRPEVLYEFADPALEQATWGHKFLLRIGSDHTNAVQQRLIEIRAQLLDAEAESEDI